MIENISLKNGPSGTDEPIIINKPTLTVFLGPNNSGKSRVLTEIYHLIIKSRIEEKILDDIELKPLTPEQARKDLLNNTTESSQSQQNKKREDSAWMEIDGEEKMIKISDYISAMTDPNGNHSIMNSIMRQRTSNITGEKRLREIEPQKRGDLKYPRTMFAKLFTDDVKRNILQEKIFGAVGFYPVFDATVGDELNLRFGKKIPQDERSLSEDTINCMRNSYHHSQVGDGVKAYTGLLLRLVAGNENVILIDEPEAFLHPDLSFKIGKEIGRFSSEGKQIFISTHSTSFLMGVIHSGANADIIRLTYDGTIGTARRLDRSQLRKMSRDPLLRSTNVLSAVFFRNVVVCEGDTDRAFYQEINERLNEDKDEHGIPDAAFINANGKHVIHRIVIPLRKLGIPTAAIMDIDALKEGGSQWTNHLQAASIPLSQHQPKGTERAEVWKFLQKSGKNPKTDGGLSLLSGTELEAAEELFRTLERYGLFIVPVGEVEHWLPKLQIRREKSRWLRSIFEAMGHDPTDPEYVVPDQSDVWTFIRRVREWLKDPDRRGIPNQ